ncbi:hypothetical protein IKE98_01670 [Candidatus Saccharibacteria bacterium]|nr:hypothetical protein [Candidatus Saccharibacteria bacterium]
MIIITKKCVEDDYYKEQLIEDYLSIMKEEIRLHGWKNRELLSRNIEILNFVIQIFEVAYSAVVPRSYNKSYGLCNDEIVYESISAHTRLMAVINLKALDFIYGPDVDEYPGGYRYKDIAKVNNRHDLPENESGDKADNGDRDDKGLAILEWRYFKKYRKLSLITTKEYEKRIKQLQKEFEEKSSEIGRLVYSGDKVSAIIMNLLLDAIGRPPKMSIYDPKASWKDKINMGMCERVENYCCYASEMWTVGYLKTRDTDTYDDTGFFTAIIVMATLLVRHKWYNWREKDYETPLI